jgi:hypothetical protein
VNQRLTYLKEKLNKSDHSRLKFYKINLIADKLDIYANFCGKCSSYQNEVSNFLNLIDNHSRNLESISEDVKSFSEQKLLDIENHLEKVHHLHLISVGNQNLLFFTKRAIKLNILLFSLYFIGFSYWSVLYGFYVVLFFMLLGVFIDYLTHSKKPNQFYKGNNHFYFSLLTKYYHILEQKRVHKLNIQESYLDEMLQFAYLVGINTNKLYYENAKSLIDDFFKDFEGYSSQIKTAESSFDKQIIYSNQYRDPLYKMISSQYKVFHTKHHRLIIWFVGTFIIFLWYFIGISDYNFYVLLFVLFNYYFLGYFLDYRLQKKFVFRSNLSSDSMNFIEIKNN